MIVAIEQGASPAYCASMRSQAMKLLLLLAVLMLPLGMAGPAAANDRVPPAAMAMHHDAGHHSSGHAKGVMAECTMACSAALPAAELRPLEIRPVTLAPEKPAPATKLTGILLEMATPPPRAPETSNTIHSNSGE